MKRTTRERVERKLKHNQFQLKYRGEGIWDIWSLTGDVIGFALDFWALDFWPYSVIIY